jgi:hypothetical protein
VPLRRDPAGFFAWSSQPIPPVSHPVPSNWVAKSVAKTGASLRQEKVQQGVSYRLDGVEILAVQVEVIEGRQSDQSCRHTAVHADIEATIV